MIRTTANTLLVLLTLVLPARAAEPEVRPEDLPRIKAVEPGDAVKTFQVRKGFHIELAASEPLVVDPIAMCFDENGRLFVIEMRDYSERRADKLGRIRMLESTHGDGKYDKSTIFLDHLPWPNAICCYNGGILVGACPDIIYAKDTNGDGVADEVKTVFTGFGSTQERLNVQGLFNNFIWGMDSRIHGCSGEDGGMVTSVLHPSAPPIDVRGKGFVIDPRDWSITTEAGGGQYGLSYSPTGQLFTCSNSSHIEAFMYDSRYANRNPFYTPLSPRVGIAADGPAAEVFRISPEEPWRVMRTRWRIAGLASGPIEGGGRSAGYFTGATGITVYRGNAFGPDYVGDAFVGDAGGNLVHHKRIHHGGDGIELIAERPADEKKSEFCASTDTWFRPVDFANAPDGCLYIADMYREVIEHPWSIPPSIKKYLDLNSGSDRGRIYRLVPDGYVIPKPPHLGSASIGELVATLENPNGWHRETAAQLLFERHDPAANAPLVELLNHSNSAYARLHALHMLDALNGLTEELTIHAFQDGDANVRSHAIALAERFIVNRTALAALWDGLQKLAGDPDASVRYQLAFTLGQLDHPDRAKILASIARRDINSAGIRTAILSSSANGADSLIANLTAEPAFLQQPAGTAFLCDTARIVGAQGNSSAITHLLELSRGDLDHGNVALGLSIAGALIETSPVTRPADIFKRAAEIAGDGAADKSVRLPAIALLAFDEYEHAAPALLLPIQKRHPQHIQLAVIASLDHFSSPRVADDLLSAWPTLDNPRVRAEVVSVLIKRPQRAERLLLSIKSGSLHQSDLSAQQVNLLLASGDSAVRTLAHETLSAPTAQRAVVIESFRGALALTGNRDHGHILYSQRCISCHRVGSEGSSVGPDLVTIRNAGKEKNLVNILDPSREVAARYIAFEIETKDGQSFLGVVTSDTTTTITIRQAFGRDVVIPRSNIARMISHGKSLMPDGLEAGLSAQDMADLLEFVASASPPP